LINILRDKESDLKLYTTNRNYGLNVDNFVSTYNYEVIMLQEQINLYEKYLDFFYHVHEKLLKRLITKISVLEAQLNADIKFEGGLIGKRKDNNDIMNDLNIKGLNKRTARDLRKSISGIHSPSTSEDDTGDVDYIPTEKFANNNSIKDVSDNNIDCNAVQFDVIKDTILHDHSSSVDKLFARQNNEEDIEIKNILSHNDDNDIGENNDSETDNEEEYTIVNEVKKSLDDCINIVNNTDNNTDNNNNNNNNNENDNDNDNENENNNLTAIQRKNLKKRLKKKTDKNNK